jgi:hypothetical protein
MSTTTVDTSVAIGSAIRAELRRQGVLDETILDPTVVALKPRAQADLAPLAMAVAAVVRRQTAN